MEKKLARDIIEVLPKDRTLFRYHEDRYAFMLLDYAMRGEMSIADIKASRFSRLLARPLVNQLMANKGGGKLTRRDFELVWTPETQNYVLTLGTWGSHISSERDWHQTSRTGVNLVLQINFAGCHDAAYQKLLSKHRQQDFSFDLHPVNEKGRTTMSWARIDLDLDTGEALIEEVQNDWVRNALWALEGACKTPDAWGDQKPALERYVTGFLKPHIKMWAEATLAATLFFLIREIGIRRIWLHDFETGNRLKNLRYSKPPKSLYTNLPKRFCFEKVRFAPCFLLGGVSRKFRKRLEVGKETFWHLAV